MNKGFFEEDETNIIRGDEVIKTKVKIMSEEEKAVYNHYVKKVIILTKEYEAINTLRSLLFSKSPLAFDYETTGKKPYRKGHKIFTVSISDGKKSYSFPFFNNRELRELWKLLLQSKTIKKIIHNAKFETIWTKVILGYYPRNIIADTMLDAHILDNRSKVGLKVLTEKYFNVSGYENSISKFIEADSVEEEKYGANAFNRIDKAPLNELLTYNALDSLFTFKIWEKQQEKMTDHLRIGSKFFLTSSLELAKVEINGFGFDTEKANKQYSIINTKMETIAKETLKMKEMKLWNKDKPFRFSATQDLSYLLFNRMKITLKETDKTETGLAKMDVDTLQKYKIPIVQNVLEWRKWKKVNDTYLKSCAREATDNKIHTSLRLENVQTFRSSAADPNLQNIPARDIEIMNIIRECFISSKGNILKEYDYKAMEASIVSCYNKDPNWTRYVSDPKNDMHRDIGSKLFLKAIKDISKDERFYTKNDFVFATIYGSYWKNTATSLWNDISKETKAWLASKNIKTLSQFKDHVHDVEDWFWHDQFPVGFAWMEKTLYDFEQKNYIDLYTGFRCYGPMSRNQVINYRVQGTASHCKLWTLKNVNKALTKNKMKSKIILEIHDSIITDTVPEEEKEVDNLIWKYGTQKIKEEWDWLTVPLFIESKVSKVNGNWAEMEVQGFLKGEK